MGLLKKLVNFFKNSKAELMKVEWPTKDEVVNSTVVVLVSILVISLGLGAMDFMLTAFIKAVTGTS